MTENREILRHIDHTFLKATAEWEEIRKLCEEAVTYGTASRLYTSLLCGKSP